MYEPETSYEEFVENEQRKYPELNSNDIDALKKRVQANPDIPTVADKMIVMYLHASYFDVEKAYKMIVARHKYSSEMPELFSDYDPTSEEMKRVYNTITICTVSNAATGKKERIVVTDFKNTDPQQYEYEPSCKYFNMVLQHMMATHGTFDGLVLVMNGKGLNWRHIYKTPMKKMKKLLSFVQEAFPVRLKEVHVLNAGSVVTLLFNIIKPFMNNGLMELVTIYSDNSAEVFEKVPIELMPVEIGGTGKSHVVLNEETYKLLVSARDWFRSLN